jgi:hypothetical protein
VVKDDDASVAGCHDTEAEADAQVEALYAQEVMDGGAPEEMSGTAWAGVLAVEGEWTGDGRMFAPGSLEWADLPLPLKWQPAESEGHTGAVIVGRIDTIVRDGKLIRGAGIMDDDGQMGAEAVRLMRKRMLRGTSIMADDTEDEDIEFVYAADDTEPVEAPEEPADGEEVEVVPLGPSKMVVHHGRIRSSTLLAEPAFVEATIELDELMTAAAYTVTIPEVWPEWWFQEPAEQPPFGALHITPEGRVFGYLGPAKVPHRAFRASGRSITIPRGVDYTEFQNKPCLVAGADGHVYRINAGNVTFDCGHPSPYDTRREDPSWAMQHYDNSCSVAARIRVGENGHGTWVAGGLLHGITPDAFERMMACALSGDWQGGKLNAALLVPVEGFPVAAASIRVRDDALVASTVPIVYDAPGPGPDTRATLERIARSVGRDATTRFKLLRQRAGR